MAKPNETQKTTTELNSPSLLWRQIGDQVAVLAGTLVERTIASIKEQITDFIDKEEQ